MQINLAKIYTRLKGEFATAYTLVVNELKILVVSSSNKNYMTTIKSTLLPRYHVFGEANPNKY